MSPELSPMSCHAVDGGSLPVAGGLSRFAGESGVEEVHLMLRPTAYAGVETQLDWLQRVYAETCAAQGLGADTVVFRRLFCSDLPNQAAVLQAHPVATSGGGEAACAVSLVGQPPLPPAKVALWAYHVRLPEGALTKERAGNWLSLQRGALVHHWTTGLIAPAGETSRAQTEAILAGYGDGLRARGLTLADHVLRTWFFVQNVDANYHGLVAARRDCFTAHGLTADTHYIASTGIAGGAADVTATVMMDAYAIAGVQPAQIRYLAAPDHLCPTHRYGVTFERGASIDYRDRRHVLISGTASIDANGQILHPGDVEQQLARTLENVRALLENAGATFKDVCHYITYVRDPSDLAIAQQLMQQHAGHAPCQLVTAPVCRPGWLIEVECMAILPAENPELPAF